MRAEMPNGRPLFFALPSASALSVGTLSAGFGASGFPCAAGCRATVCAGFAAGLFGLTSTVTDACSPSAVLRTVCPGGAAEAGFFSASGWPLRGQSVKCSGP